MLEVIQGGTVCHTGNSLANSKPYHYFFSEKYHTDMSLIFKPRHQLWYLKTSAIALSHEHYFQLTMDQKPFIGWTLLYVVLCLIVFGCQYQCNWLPGKTRLQNDPLWVEWDVKPYTLTHSDPLRKLTAPSRPHGWIGEGSFRRKNLGYKGKGSEEEGVRWKAGRGKGQGAIPALFPPPFLVVKTGSLKFLIAMLFIWQAEVSFNVVRCKLMYVIVKKRISQRFFASDRDAVTNPPPGTVIDNTVTRPHS